MDTTATRWRMRRQRPVRRAGRVVTMLRAVTLLAAVGVLAAACSHSSSGSSTSSPGSLATAGPLAFARCMRAHGVPDFPDPGPSGNFDLSSGADLNPANPAFQAAAQACRSFGSAGKRAGPSLSPLQIAATVKFAQCMRNHGITNYPDPDSSGHIPSIRHSGVNPSSPQFQPAVNACRHYMHGVPGWGS